MKKNLNFQNVGWKSGLKKYGVSLTFLYKSFCISRENCIAHIGDYSNIFGLFEVKLEVFGLEKWKQISSYFIVQITRNLDQRE